MMKSDTCCFTGHRRLPQHKIARILLRLDEEIGYLYQQDIRNYISGGAMGFDQMAASLIIAQKDMGYPLKLIFALPCKNQDQFWNNRQKRLYRNLLTAADEIVYVSEDYHDGCMQKRNQFMVEQSGYCICALLHPASGTGQTVNLARRKGLIILNTAD